MRGLGVLFLLALAVLQPAAAAAQRAYLAHYAAETEAGETVMLRLDGDVVIRAVAGSELRVVTHATYRGRIYGYANRDPTGAYALRMRRNSGELRIEPESRESLLILGISTVRERFRTEIHVPRSARLVVRVGSGDIRIESPSSHVEVETRRGDIHLDAAAQALGSLSARTERGTVIVAGLHAGPEFFRTESGSAVVVLRTRRGEIHIR